MLDGKVIRAAVCSHATTSARKTFIPDCPAPRRGRSAGGLGNIRGRSRRRVVVRQGAQTLQ